jgi:hypothetical protein
MVCVSEEEQFDFESLKGHVADWMHHTEESIDSSKGISWWLESSLLDELIQSKIDHFDPEKTSKSIQVSPIKQMYRWIWSQLSLPEVKQKYDDMTRTRAAVFATYLCYYENPHSSGWNHGYGNDCWNGMKQDHRGFHRFFRRISNSFISKHWVGLVGRHKSKFRKYVAVLEDIGMVKSHQIKKSEFKYPYVYEMILPFDLWKVGVNQRYLFDFWEEMGRHLEKDFFKEHFSDSVFRNSFMPGKSRADEWHRNHRERKSIENEAA